MIYLNGHRVVFEKFPNGETRVKDNTIAPHIEANSKMKVVFQYIDDTSLTELLFVKRHLDMFNIQASLRIMYMPYSRMDRSEDGSVFTLKYVCDFINWLNFSNVIVLEPHSDVAPALLDRCTVAYSTVNLFDEVCRITQFNLQTDSIVFPDSGAAKRYGKQFRVENQLVGYKQRDFKTGKILSYDMLKPSNFDGLFGMNGKKAIIIDDLCVYGGTFKACAEELKKMGFGKIYLLVGHCENAIFEGDLFKEPKLIDMVFTTNSILKFESNHQISVFDLIRGCWS